MSGFDSFLNNGFDNKSYIDDITKSATYLQKDFLGSATPDVVVVLGSGLGLLADEMDTINKISYDDIPGFPKFRSVQGHAGELIYGALEGKKVLLMSGRYHFYEYADIGATNAMKLITLPMRVFQALHIPNLIVSNAAGCVNENFNVGELMIIKDHINHMGSNPLLGSNIDSFGPRFSPMTNAYDRSLIQLTKDIAGQHNIKINEGIYLALTGPTYETQAEYDRVKRQGADAVGMSTIPEVMIARHAHDHPMNVLGLTVVTNLGGSHINNPPSHQEVMEAANKAMPDMITVVKGVIKDM